MRIPRQRKKLERDIENKVVKHAKKRGLVVRKMNGLGNRSWPDRLFMGRDASILWIEFKREGEEATPDQLLNHEMLKELGHHVHMVDDVNDGIALVNKLPAKGLPQAMQKILTSKKLRKALKNYKGR